MAKTIPMQSTPLQKPSEDDDEKEAMLKELQELRYNNYINSLDNDRNFKLVLLQHLQAIKEGIDAVKESIDSASGGE